MKRAMFRGLLLMLVALPWAAKAAPDSSGYLFVWAMEARHPQADTMALKPTDLAARRTAMGLGRDFLAVFDVRPGPSFGKLVAMAPDDMLYANDWLGNSTYVFDLRKPTHPRLARTFGSVGALGYPHSFAHLAN